MFLDFELFEPKVVPDGLIRWPESIVGLVQQIGNGVGLLLRQPPAAVEALFHGGLACEVFSLLLTRFSPNILGWEWVYSIVFYIGELMLLVKLSNWVVGRPSILMSYPLLCLICCCKFSFNWAFLGFIVLLLG